MGSEILAQNALMAYSQSMVIRKKSGRNLIGKRMNNRRRALGLSAEELAKQMGEQGVKITVQQVDALERGERRALDKIVLAASKALGVTANWLVTGRD